MGAGPKFQVFTPDAATWDPVPAFLGETELASGAGSDFASSYTTLTAGSFVAIEVKAAGAWLVSVSRDPPAGTQGCSSR